MLLTLALFLTIFFLMLLALDAFFKSTPYGTKAFENKQPTKRDLQGLLRFLGNRQIGFWRPHTPNAFYSPPPERVYAGVRITFINHATLLIQMDGINILTDPVWSDRASPFSFVGPKRARKAGLELDQLPMIDVVLISHNHYDHLDLDTLHKLKTSFNPLILMGTGNQRFLRKNGFVHAEDLGWWGSHPHPQGIKITAVPAQHFSGRSLSDYNKTLWVGFVIEGVSGSVYFAGDTGMGPHFAEIRERFQKIDVALLPIGAFKPEWFMSPMHISPKEAVEAADLLGAKISIPIHYGTFRLADDGQDEPLSELKQALDTYGKPLNFRVLDHGEAMMHYAGDSNARNETLH
jgi:L-ascorbate metabolism protein UlaG (beta-lactamase superfamily)